MTMKVYNTLTRQKETFVPVEPGKVKIYVCGVTPYNHPHIGNARPFVTWDVIRRYFVYLGYDVQYVQNFTDVDDKIINAANTENVSWDVIANRYIASYFEIMDSLGVKRADVYPRVSEHIPEIIDVVQKLIDKGFAYVIDGDVYYKITAFDDYGHLSGRTLDDMQAGARVDIDDRKENPMDFALWKSAKPGEPAWESPWGQGRPGWHIECSAMSIKYLGETFDFHGGGSDLIFPHHENEIAQSEAYTGKPFVHYWLHNGFITVNEEKMSKSLGNFFLVQDITKHYSPAVLRFFLIATHYRSPLDFSDERLSEEARGLERLTAAYETLTYLKTLSHDGPSADSSAFVAAAKQAEADFVEAMNDDFNTSLAVSALFNLAKEINIYHSKVVSEKSGNDAKAVQTVMTCYARLADVLGLKEAFVSNTTVGADAELTQGLMDLILSIRAEARQKKDWATADKIRDALGQLNIIVEDSPQGARWKKQ